MDDQQPWNEYSQDQRDAVYMLYGIFLAAGILIFDIFSIVGLIPPKQIE